MKWYWWVLVVVFVAVGILTLVPFPVGSSNMLGYDSLDPFAPVSSLVCWFIAAVCYWRGLRASKKTA